MLSRIIVDELVHQGGTVEHGSNAWGSVPKLYVTYNNPDGVTVIDVKLLVQRLLDEAE